MVLYRVRYTTDALGKNIVSKEFDDFKKMKKFAKKILEFTRRMVHIDWAYGSNPNGWMLLRSCPNENDINNIKEKH